MARYQVILAYDGTDFLGSQRQGQRRTVQLELEHALREMGWEGRSVLMAGRTDSGVHAVGQTAAFDLDWRHSAGSLLRALNANLPGDLAVQALAETRKDFHPRFDAIARTYRYRVYFSPQRNPLEERYGWRVWPEAEQGLLEQAASRLEGTHDFRSFGRAHEKGGATIRHVYQAWWEVGKQSALFHVKGNAFLYHMVRRMVHAQMMVGLGKLDLEQFANALNQGYELHGGLAPAQGLTLIKIDYAPSRQEALRIMQSLS